MDTTTLAELKSALEAERDRLAEELKDLERDSSISLSDGGGENNYRDHMADQGTATSGKELEMQLEGNARELYEQVGRALERIDRDEYGACIRCAEPIALERLRAVPAAELCISCKEWEESR